MEKPPKISTTMLMFKSNYDIRLNGKHIAIDLFASRASSCKHSLDIVSPYKVVC